MNRREPDELLHRLAERQSSGRSDAVLSIDDASLEAYAEGRLSAAERLGVEAVLVDSASARSRLLELRGVDAAGPSPLLRRRVLEGIPRPRPRRRRRWQAAVAAIAAVLLAVLGLQLQAPEPLPANLDFEVRAFGIADERGTVAGDRVQALPDTILRFEVAPVDAAEADVAFGLYRCGKASCRRLAAADGLTVEAERGAALMFGRAEALLGSRAGSHVLWVVVARPGGLPHEIEVSSDQTLSAALSAEGRRRVIEQHIDLLAAP